MLREQTQRFAIQNAVSAVRYTKRQFNEICLELRLFQSYYKLLEIQGLHWQRGVL